MKTHWHRAAAAAGLAILAGTAMAGPDVIVGDLPDVWYWGSVGSSPNIVDVYSVATTSCNKGDSPLEWIRTTNRHPVIGQNAYRYDIAGTKRFEQIGQSWLKHGFTALQGTVCFSDCNAYPDGSHLGVHCSDPYGSSLNGDQTRLGPKWQVNATTGLYTYPYTDSGATGTGAKRLQVLRSDLQTSGALYFVSGQYVAPDDAESGNGGNNESYRRVTVNGSTFAMTTTGTTQREKAAIQAWKDNGLGAGQADNSIVITQYDIPTDGRVFVGVKVIDVGGGQFRYEYAVENLTSDRSGASFSIPLPPNAVVTSPYFHDVPYHSGEPYDGTDWAVTVNSSSITWNCTQTHAQNANANALRWGTLYNFGFTTNVSPSGGAATLGLFKPGAVPSVTIGTLIPSPDGQNHPLNDTCAGAIDIGNGVTNFSTVGASTDGLAEACGQITKDVWYRWTNGTCANPATISTCGSGFDTKIAIYPGSACPSAPGQAIACDDNGGACGTGSSVTFAAAANTAYLIRVGSPAGAEGSGSLTVTPPYCPPPPGPANDACANAIWLTDNVAYSESTGAANGHVAATNDGTASCGLSTTSPDVWFKYRPATTGTVTLVTCGSTMDTVLSLHSGTCGSLTQLSCNDDNNGNGPCAGGTTSWISTSLTANVTYYIRVAGYQGATGAYSVKVIGGGGVAPPANDNCADRATIALGSTNFSTSGATTDGVTHTGCNFNGSNQITNDIWYNFVSPGAGTLTVDTCTTATFNTKLAVYSGDSCSNYDARLLACNDDGAGCSAGRAKAELHVDAGQAYNIRLGGVNGATGTGVVTLAFVADPACDADVNQDGNSDQGDVDYLINVVAGGDNPTGIDPDFNHDGNADQSDIDALVNVVAGGPCP